MAASNRGISIKVVLMEKCSFTTLLRIQKIGEIQICSFVPEMISVYVLRLAQVGIDY